MQKNDCSMLQLKNLTKLVVFFSWSNKHGHFAVSAVVLEMRYGFEPSEIQ